METVIFYIVIIVCGIGVILGGYYMINESKREGGEVKTFYWGERKKKNGDDSKDGQKGNSL